MMLLPDDATRTQTPSGTRTYMSYENAPATILLATHCCICGRPLLDADSVEIGIGPTCRKGIEADTAPDWAATSEQLALWVAEAPQDDQRRVMFEQALEAQGDDHKFSNVLTRYIAAARGKSPVGHLVFAIRLMGRSRLADALASRLYEIRLRTDDSGYLVKSPYSDTFKLEMRRIGGRWEKEGKFYRVPATSKAALFTALKASYAGQRAFGPRGEFSL